jgi:hypothetical protein
LLFGAPGFGRRRLDQFGEQVAVVDHRLAQVFRAGVAAGVPQRHVMGDAVVGDEARVVDRQVGGALLEVGDRIAAGRHHLADQLVGAGDRRTGVVDELGLHMAPAVDVTVGLDGGQAADVEALDALLPAPELDSARWRSPSSSTAAIYSAP